MKTTGAKQEKKLTNAQLLSRLRNSVLHIDRTKNTRQVYFDDKGLRLVDTDDYILIETGFHTHVFSKITNSGFSRPCLYVSRIIEMAIENEKDFIDTDENGNVTRSYAKMVDALKKKENQSEFNIAMYCDWYFFNLFIPLYRIDENAPSQFMTYFDYVHNLACQSVLLDEHKDGLTNIQFIEKQKKLMEDMLEGIGETVIFEPMSDEQRMKLEMDAMNAQSIEENIQGQ